MSESTRYEKLTAEIEHLQSVLNSGATSATADGVSASYDHASIRKRIAELIRQKNNIRRSSFLLGINVSGGGS